MRAPLRLATVNNSVKHHQTDAVFDILRLLFNDFEEPPSFLQFGRLTGKIFSKVQSLVAPDYYQWPITERFNMAASRTCEDADAVRLALHQNWIPSASLEMTDTFGRTLLHIVASQLEFYVDIMPGNVVWIEGTSRRFAGQEGFL